MLKRRWTFQEAHERLILMPQMHLLKVKEALWVQLDRAFETVR